MISPVTQRPRARLDLLEQFVYFGEQAGVDLAERYFAAVDATCLQLLDHPQSGILYDSGVWEPERPSAIPGQRLRELPPLLLAAPERYRRHPSLSRCP
jgi:plasmid stabilization system protein ParE